MAGIKVSETNMPDPPTFVETACQTDAMQVPLMPLPICYPANLIYAQNMLAITLNQMHQLDLSIAQLRLRLCEHEVRALTCGAASNPRFSPICLPGGTPKAIDKSPAEILSRRAAENGDDQPPGAAHQPHAAGGLPNQPQQLEHPRVHRRRLAAAVKIALVMILLEFRAGWFFLYFFAVFLYVGGLFDPFIEWFQRPSVQATLEQQLTALRNRQQRMAENAANSMTDVPDVHALAGGQLNEHNVDARSTNPVEQETSTDDGTTGNNAAAAPPVSDSGAEAAAERDATHGNADGAAEAQQPPWGHRFIYQLVVMFFMTLMPWWNPNPRYL